MLHLHEGPDYGHTTDRVGEIKRKRKKPSIRQDSNPRPLCHEVTRCVLYRCATTTAQEKGLMEYFYVAISFLGVIGGNSDLWKFKLTESPQMKMFMTKIILSGLVTVDDERMT